MSSEPVHTPVSASESGPPSGTWRASNNWRTRDSATATTAPRFSKFPAGRTSGTSWRDREKRNATEGSAENGSSRSVPSDSMPKGRSTYQRDDEATTAATEEGRRVYVGNLRYLAKPGDIEDLLKRNDLGHFSNIHISIDPFTGRNPSYCFVEFPDAESASKAMQVLDGQDLLGRKVKCGPCQKGKGSGNKPIDTQQPRWGHWTGEKNGADDKSRQVPASFDRYKQDFTGRRLYVGGLPRMQDQATNYAEMTELFQGFKIDTISKRISAHESLRDTPGHHDYCFVDLESVEEANAALESMANGVTFKGLPLNINAAKGKSNKWQERDDLRSKPAPSRDWSDDA
ncbi:RNA-binding domain-containing protein [Xylariaceae sp. FL0255]|nr:RNA-binding domain-containing protein [Xylariaceae sp. FL0255]